MKLKWFIVGGLIVALLAVCGGMAAIFWLTFAQLRTSGIRWQWQGDYTSKAEADESQSFSVGLPATLSVENARGKITVTGGSGSEIIIAAHKTVWGASPADASAALQALEISYTQSGDTVTVRVQPPVEVSAVRVGPSNTTTVDFTITVPFSTAVTARTSFGDITLSGAAGDADLHTDFGAIQATNLTGGLKAASSSGAITAQQVQGSTADLELSSDFGNLTLEHASGAKVTVHSSSGELSLTDVQASGAVDLSSDFGGITFENSQAQALTVKASSSRITLTALKVSGALAARSNFGDVILNQAAAASYDLHSSSGAVKVDGASGAVRAASDYGAVEVVNGEKVTLDLHTSSGQVKFAGTLGAGPHTLKTDFGNVELRLPKDTAMTVDLQTDFGKVKSDFPISLSGDLDSKHWAGAINGGGEKVTATTNSGDIALEILNP